MYRGVGDWVVEGRVAPGAISSVLVEDWAGGCGGVLPTCVQLQTVDDENQSKRNVSWPVMAMTTPSAVKPCSGPTIHMMPRTQTPNTVPAKSEANPTGWNKVENVQPGAPEKDEHEYRLCDNSDNNNTSGSTSPYHELRTTRSERNDLA